MFGEVEFQELGQLPSPPPPPPIIRQGKKIHSNLRIRRFNNLFSIREENYFEDNLIASHSLFPSDAGFFNMGKNSSSLIYIL